MPNQVKLGIVLLICTTVGVAYPRKPFNLQALVQESDLIIVVDLTKIENRETTAIVVDGRQLAGNAHEAEMRTERCIKGICPDELSIGFTTPIQYVGYPGIATGHQIAFLKQYNGSYAFTDRHYPLLPASRSAGEVEPDPLAATVSELGRVLSSTDTSAAQKQTVLAQAYGIPNLESFRASLRAGMRTAADQDLKYRMQAELISRGDASALHSTIDLLLGMTLTDEQRQIFLRVISQKVSDSSSSPAIVSLLMSSDRNARRAAAEALWHMADPDTLPDLLRILQDPDTDVRFYAVRAISDIANEPGWGGPSQSQFEGHEQEYVRHWQNWAKDRHVR